MDNPGHDSSAPLNGNFEMDNHFLGNPSVGQQMFPGSVLHNLTDLLQMPAATATQQEAMVDNYLGGPSLWRNALLDETPNLLNGALELLPEGIDLNMRDEDLELHLGAAPPSLRIQESSSNLVPMDHLNPVTIRSGGSENLVVDNDQVMPRKRPLENETGYRQTKNAEAVVFYDDGAGGSDVRIVRQRPCPSHQASNTNHGMIGLQPPSHNADRGETETLFAVFQFAVKLSIAGHSDLSMVNESFRIFSGNQTFEPAVSPYGNHVNNQVLHTLGNLGPAGQEIIFADKVYHLPDYLHASIGLFLRFGCQVRAFNLLPPIEQGWLMTSPHELGGFWSGFVENFKTYCALPPRARDWVFDHVQMVMKFEWTAEMEAAELRAAELREAELIRAAETRHRRRQRRARRSARRVRSRRGSTSQNGVPTAENGAEERAGDLGQMPIDLDRMSYEEILALQESIGNAETGLTELSIYWIVHHDNFIAPSAEDDVDPCVVCLEDYKDGEQVGTLPCSHRYHYKCIKEWLLKKNCCPICKAEVLYTP